MRAEGRAARTMPDLVHCFPEGDLRGHVTDDGPFCPCMPELHDGVWVHNSYDGREVGEVVLGALDTLGVALAGHGHAWTRDERVAYERAVALLQRHHGQ